MTNITPSEECLGCPDDCQSCEISKNYSKGYEFGSEETYMDIQKLCNYSNEVLNKLFGTNHIQNIILRNGLKDIQEIIGRHEILSR